MGLVPLLYEPRELLLKASSMILYLAVFYPQNNQYDTTATPSLTTTTTGSRLASIVRVIIKYVPLRLHVLLLLLVWIVVDMIPLRYFGRFTFVPLTWTSLVCAVGLTISFVRLAYDMITTTATTTKC